MISRLFLCIDYLHFPLAYFRKIVGVGTGDALDIYYVKRLTILADTDIARIVTSRCEADDYGMSVGDDASSVRGMKTATANRSYRSLRDGSYLSIPQALRARLLSLSPHGTRNWFPDQLRILARPDASL
jgi:hypothetical protein